MFRSSIRRSRLFQGSRSCLRGGADGARKHDLSEAKCRAYPCEGFASECRQARTSESAGEGVADWSDRFRRLVPPPGIANLSSRQGCAEPTSRQGCADLSSRQGCADLSSRQGCAEPTSFRVGMKGAGRSVAPDDVSTRPKGARAARRGPPSGRGLSGRSWRLQCCLASGRGLSNGSPIIIDRGCI